MLNSRDIAIFLVAQELGVNFDVYEKEPRQRILLQKLFYLIGLTREGKFLQMDFSLNSRGPYSPDLAEIGHEISEEFSELKKAVSLNDEGRKLVKDLLDLLPDTFKNIIKNLPDNSLDDSNIAEIEAIASMAMFCKNYDLEKDKETKRTRVIIDLISLKDEMKNADLNKLYEQAANFIDTNANKTAIANL